MGAGVVLAVGGAGVHARTSTLRRRLVRGHKLGFGISGVEETKKDKKG